MAHLICARSESSIVNVFPRPLCTQIRSHPRGQQPLFKKGVKIENGFTVVVNRARCSLCSVTRLTTRVQTNVPEAVSGAKVRSLSRLPHSRHRRPSGIASCGVRRQAQAALVTFDRVLHGHARKHGHASVIAA